MKRISGIVCAVYLVISAGFSTAQDNKPDPRLVTDLMNKSGLNKQLEQMPQMVQAGMAKANEDHQMLSPEELSEMSGMAASAFDAGMLKQAVQKKIELNLTEQDTRAVLAWLDTPLAGKIAKLEENASTPEATAEMLHMTEQLTANAARVDQVKKLNKALKATEMVIAMVMNTQTALIAALTGKMKPEERPSIEDIESEVKKSRGQLVSVIESQTVIAYLYSYRELTDDEIGQYLQFAESASGRKYHAIVADGLHAALSAAAHGFANRIEQSVDKAQNVKKRINT